MKLRKIIFSICCGALLALAASIGAAAAEPDGMVVTMLKVNLANGDCERFIFPDHPSMTFDGADMVVTSDVAESRYLRSTVAHFDFERGIPPGTSAVESATATPDTFLFSFADNATVVMASEKLTRADLFTIGGAKVASAPAVGGVVTLSVAELPAGVYIVAPDCREAVKIIKK